MTLIQNLKLQTDWLHTQIAGNIFVEDVSTGKSAMMTFGAKADIDYDAIHETVDSVNVTSNRIWAKVLLGKEWKTFEKNIELK
jgi:hypothetical protein